MPSGGQKHLVDGRSASTGSKGKGETDRKSAICHFVSKCINMNFLSSFTSTVFKIQTQLGSNESRDEVEG